MTLRQQQEYLVRNRTFPFLLYYCVHSSIAANRIAMRFAVRSAPPFCYPTKRTDNSKGGIWSGSQPQKRQTRFIRACRLIFINITLSNRIVKPNNRYTRQPASHDFLFYSAPDKVYVLTATNRIAMRFAVRSAPPFRYRTKRTDNSKGGIWSGTLPPAA